MTWYAVARSLVTLSATEWFHGTSTPKAFDRFDLNKYKADQDDDNGGVDDKHWNSYLGVHFTSEHHTAQNIADVFQGRVYHCSLKMQNPKHYESEHHMTVEAHRWARGKSWGNQYGDLDWDHSSPEHRQRWQTDDLEDDLRRRNGPLARAFRDHIKSQGHDGITYGNEYEGTKGHTCAIAFDPDDITIERHHAVGEGCRESVRCDQCGLSKPKERVGEYCRTCGSGIYEADAPEEHVASLTQHFAAKRQLDPKKLTQKHLDDIHDIVEGTRMDEGDGGQCGFVAEQLTNKHGWPAYSGYYHHADGRAIGGHVWNVHEPSGTIIDATADQFGEGHHIRIVTPDDPEHRRYQHAEVDETGDNNHDDMRRFEEAGRLHREHGAYWWTGGPTEHSRAYEEKVKRYTRAYEEKIKQYTRGHYGKQAAAHPATQQQDSLRALHEQVRAQESHAGDRLCEPMASAIEHHFGWPMELGHYAGPEVGGRSGHDETEGYGHNWNRMSDGTIVDGAAHQFGDDDPIRVIPVDDPRQQHYHTDMPTQTDIEEGVIRSRYVPWGPGHPLHRQAAKDDDVEQIMNLLGPGVPRAKEPSEEEKAQAEADQQRRIQEHEEWQSQRKGYKPGDDLSDWKGYPHAQWVPIKVAQRFRDHYGDQNPGRSEGIVDHLTEDMKQRGMTDPLMLLHHNEENVAHLGEGNHRLRAAERLGWSHVPMRVVRMYDSETTKTNHMGLRYKHIFEHWRGEHEGRTPEMCKPSDVFSKEILGQGPKKQAARKPAQPLPFEPGRDWYRVHHPDRPWSPAGARSRTGFGNYDLDDGDAAEGYSAFANPHDLHRYWTTEGGQDYETGGIMQRERLVGKGKVVRFEGHHAGWGLDYEPTVVPNGDPEESMSWDEFKQRLAVTPHPKTKTHWHDDGGWWSGNGERCPRGSNLLQEHCLPQLDWDDRHLIPGVNKQIEAVKQAAHEPEARSDRLVLYRAEGPHEAMPGYAGKTDIRTGRYFGSLPKAMKHCHDDRHLYEVHLSPEETWRVHGDPEDHVLVSREQANRKQHSEHCPHPEHRKQAAVRQQQNGPQGDLPSGIMIALVPPATLAEQLELEQPEAETAENLHVTLAYLGEVADHSEAQLEALPELIEAWAEGQPKMTARLQGVGTFYPAQEDGQHVLWGSVDIPGVHRLHAHLVDYLKDHGFEPREDHGFTAHVTLAYGPKHWRFLPKVPDTTWRVHEVWCCIGGKWQSFPFKGSR